MTSNQKSRYNVQPKTYIVRDFDFKNMVHPFDKKSEEIWSRPNWKEFNLKMDTSKVVNHQLESNGKRWFPKRKSAANFNLSFSPVLFNDKKDLALVTISCYATDTHWRAVYYLEFISDKGWQIINSFQFAIS